MTSKKTQELNLFIVWQSGEKYINRILSDISDRFHIKKLISMHWAQSDVCANLTRLYPQRTFDFSSPKIREIGATQSGCRLHVIIVQSDDPVFLNGINQDVFAFKKNERKKYGENYLHSADNESEAYRNINCLAGLSLDAFEHLRKQKTKFYVFNNKNKKAYCTESIAFDSLSQVFSALNKNVKWAVLRNWENLEESKLIEGHGDIDILVDDYHNALLSLNGRTIHDTYYRVQHYITVKNKKIPLDIRYIGDDYYTKPWEIELLRNREFHHAGFYHLNETNHFWSLLYHGLIHKPYMKNDYIVTLQKIGTECIKEFNPDILLCPKTRFNLLKTYLQKKKYSITRPLDKSVYYRYSLRAYILQFKNLVTPIAEKTGIKDSLNFKKAYKSLSDFRSLILIISNKLSKKIKTIRY